MQKREESLLREQRKKCYWTSSRRINVTYLMKSYLSRRNISNSVTVTHAKIIIYYLTDKEPSIQQYYDAVKANFNGEVPSLSSFKRFLYTVPDSTLALYRKGNKFFEDNYLPSIPTDYDSVPSNYEWVADHHVYDVIVNDKGKVGRAWLSTWLDRRSRYILGYVIRMADPNADTVLDSFVEAVKRCGLPQKIQIDNGKDYTVHDLFNLDNDYSLAAELNLKVRHSIPYNAKAKSIERAFRSIESFFRIIRKIILLIILHCIMQCSSLQIQVKKRILTSEMTLN